MRWSRVMVAIQVINAPATLVYSGYDDVLAYRTNDGHYTFNRTPTCVSATDSGNATALASVTDQTMDFDAATELPRPRGEVCDVVERLVDFIAPKIAPAQPHPTYAFTQQSGLTWPYLQLMQAGHLTVPPGITTKVSLGTVKPTVSQGISSHLATLARW